MNVTFDNFQQLAARTLKDLGSEEANLDHMYYGILDEVGEISKLFKKALVKGEEVDRVGLIEECGDVLWFIAGAATIRGYKLKVENPTYLQDNKPLRLLTKISDLGSVMYKHESIQYVFFLAT